VVCLPGTIYAPPWTDNVPLQRLHMIRRAAADHLRIDIERIEVVEYEKVEPPAHHPKIVVLIQGLKGWELAKFAMWEFENRERQGELGCTEGHPRHPVPCKWSTRVE
jgi:hypothetical protein